MYRILVVDDMASIREFLSRVLSSRGVVVEKATGGREALAIMEGGGIDIVISDIRMEPVSGLELLKIAHEKDPTLPVILMAGFEDLETAAMAFKNEAFDYLVKPLELNDLISTCGRATAYRRALNGIVELPLVVGRYPQLDDMVTESQIMVDFARTLQQLAPVQSPILIAGEKGSGRALAAREFHQRHRRQRNRRCVVPPARLS